MYAYRQVGCDTFKHANVKANANDSQQPYLSVLYELKIVTIPSNAISTKTLDLSLFFIKNTIITSPGTLAMQIT
jgi:hypothetical protein